MREIVFEDPNTSIQDLRSIENSVDSIPFATFYMQMSVDDAVKGGCWVAMRISASP